MRHVTKTFLVRVGWLLALVIVATPAWSQTHIWSQGFGDSGNDLDAGIAVDGAGNVLVTGRFEATVDFGGGPLTDAGSRDIFVAKYDGAGAHIWSERFGSTSFDAGIGTAVVYQLEVEDPRGGMVLSALVSAPNTSYQSPEWLVDRLGEVGLRWRVIALDIEGQMVGVTSWRGHAWAPQ